MALTHKKEIGNFGEDVACKHLKQKGFRIIERNLHISRDEIDIIAENRELIIFVEVKTRSTEGADAGNYGSAGRAVNHKKRHDTLRAARAYLARYNGGKQPRIDVIEVYLSRSPLGVFKPRVIQVNHIENAFDASGNIS
jgi:putative endonuclease